MWSEVAKSFQHGDGYVYFMLFVGFIGSVIFFERLIMLQFIFNLDFKKFTTNLKKMIRAEDYDRAISLCRSASKTSLPMISLKALEAAESDPTSVRGTIEEEAIDFLPRIESRLGALPGIATLVLLIGILGTIDALWTAFHSIDVLDTAQKQASVGNNIAASLSYTTIGLLLCIVFLVGHQFLKGLAIKITERIHHGVAVLMNLLVPQELAMMPLAAGAGVAPNNDFNSAAEMNEVQASAEPTSAEEPGDDDDFDDASVEDIKDEEEII